MTNYLGNQDSFSQGGTNGGYVPSAGGDSVNPLIKDIVPDVDIMRDIGQPLKRIKTGYYSRLDVTNSDPPVLGLAIQAALSAGGFLLQDESAGFGFTPLKELTITRIFIQKSILPALPVARTVKIWQEPGTLLHTGIISNVNDDGLNWYTDVNWIVPANVAIRYATDVPNGTSIHVSPAAAFSPVFVDFLQSVSGAGYGVYPANAGLYPAVPLGNFRFTTEPDTSITYNGAPVALLTDLTEGNVSLTALQSKTQYQSILGPNITGFTDLYASGEFTVQGNSGVGNLLVQGELKCDQIQAIFEAGVDVTGGISADNLELPGYPDVDGTLTTLSDRTQYLSAPYREGSLFTGPLEVNGSSTNLAIRGTFFPTFLRSQTIVTGFAFTPKVSCNITSILLQKNLFVDVSTPRVVKLWVPDDPLFPGAGGTEVQSTTVSNVGGDALNWIKVVSWPITVGQAYRIGFDSIPGDYSNAVAMALDSYSSTLTIDRQLITRNPPSSGTYPNSTGVFTYSQMGNITLDAPIGGFFINNKDPLLYPSLSPLETKTQNQTAIANTTTFVNTLELKGSNTYALKASTNDFEVERIGVGDVLNYNATTANVTMPIVRGMYIGPGIRPVVSGGFVQTANSVTVVSSTTETVINGTGVGSLTMAANTAVAGSCSLFRIRGSYGTNANNTVLELRLRGGVGGVGGTSISFIAPNIQTAAGPGSTWVWDLLFTCRSPGGANNFQLSHILNFTNQVFTANGLTTLDTTVSNAMTITARWQVNSPNNLINTNQMITTNYYQPTA